jgi:hypothetical protein
MDMLGTLRGISFFILLVLTTGCAQSLLHKKDYHASLQAHYEGHPATALHHFPTREANSFIATMEQTYLKLLQGDPDIDALQKYAYAIEDRVRYDVSREAKSFFYLRTPEDYYASEHEIIWLHFLLSWGYSLRGEQEKGCIEARKSAHLLSYTWSEEGHFDDPAMRIFLAGLWALCGSWEDAQVDFRAAWELDHSLHWAKELGDMMTPPKDLVVALGGVGPIPYWQPELSLNPIRSGRKVLFLFKGRKNPLQLADKNRVMIKTYMTPDSKAWYERHLIRDNAIQDLILDSHYGKDVIAQTGIASARIITSTTVGLAYGIGGTALGGLIVYVGLKGNSGELITFGAGIAIAGIKKGADIAKKGTRRSIRDMEERLDPSKNYRFVRFLPEYFWVAWDEEGLTYPLSARLKTCRKTIPQPTVKGTPNVSIIHFSDVRETYSTLWR